MGRLSSSWSLLRQCWSVLLGNKKLLLFPVVNLFFTAMILLFFLTPVAFYPTGHEVTSSEHWESLLEMVISSEAVAAQEAANDVGPESESFTNSPLFMGLMAAFYIISMFVVTFLNTAFFHEILEALAGRKVSIRNGLAFAMTRIKSIALWSLFAGLVGYLLRMLEERFGFVGRMVIGLIGVVWSVAAVFAIPVMIRDPEASNPLRVLKTSALLIKSTWGEGLIGYAGIKGFGLLVMLPFVLVLIAISAVLISVDINPEIVIPFAILALLIGIVVLSYISSVFSSIFQCALYVYAADGDMPGPFDNGVAESVWKSKKKKK
ncbi:MAG: hypothetical protein HRU15_04755 [Planctomycetes bacterium]|nr:hypothetical protein [Planctomycetota bacterium]